MEDDGVRVHSYSRTKMRYLGFRRPDFRQRT